jgi:hypothetical protein
MSQEFNFHTGGLLRIPRIREGLKGRYAIAIRRIAMTLFWWEAVN